MRQPTAELARRSRWTRRGAFALGLGAMIGAAAPFPPRPARAQGSATPIPPGDPAETALAIARDAMPELGLNAVLLRIVEGDTEIVTAAMGQSMAGVPATTDMHFRNGAVAISYVTTLLLRFVDRGMAGLDDPIAAWLPDLPEADRVTLRMLSNMTAGYPDYVQNPKLADAIYADPFRQWTTSELLALSLERPRVFAPGENWDYAHTDIVILGRALEAIGGAPLAELLRNEVLDPLGLRDTVSSDTPEIPQPVLHAYTAERRTTLGIPEGVPFLEESTYWNPSWTLASGAIQTTTIADMATGAAAVGDGRLLSEASHRAQVDPVLRGFGKPLEGCPACHTLGGPYVYGLGIVINGSWLLQNPLFAGYGATAAYLPSRRLTVAVATTFTADAFQPDGGLKVRNPSQELYRRIGAALAPEDSPVS